MGGGGGQVNSEKRREDILEKDETQHFTKKGSHHLSCTEKGQVKKPQVKVRVERRFVTCRLTVVIGNRITWKELRKISANVAFHLRAEIVREWGGKGGDWTGCVQRGKELSSIGPRLRRAVRTKSRTQQAA